MGKKYSKQAWISREGPEGDCVVENDTINFALNLTEEPKERASCTADFTYKGYPVNLLKDGTCESEKELSKKYSYFDYPIEVVELPDEPDGKKYDVYFEREGQVEASTQTAPLHVTALSECGQSAKSTTSERQEWSYTLYDFEEQGHVTKEDLRNLVKSIYDVLGKNMNKAKGSQKDPVKKLCVRLSVSKERRRDETKRENQDCLLASRRIHGNVGKTRARRCLSAEREEGSMIVNPPSADCLSQTRLQSSQFEPSQPENYLRHHRRTSSCKRCTLKQPSEKNLPKQDPRKLLTPVDSKGLYMYPKRMQTWPGECTPPTTDSDNMTRVREWINLGCDVYENADNEATEEHHHHKHKDHHYRECQPAACEGSLRRYPQYLDLATDHVTYPYHTDSLSFEFTNVSQRLPGHHKHSENHQCKRHCSKDRDDSKCHERRQPIIHRHEHHHHHSHHHYHHYVS